MLEIKNLSKTIDGLKILENINLSIKEHEILAIVGPSGCGKSTLLNSIADIIIDYEGEIKKDNLKIGYVFQEDRLLPWLTVYDNIKIVREIEDRDRIMSLIKEIGLTGFENYYPDQISGGMRQRCGIARAFYYGSDLLLMDEPFKSLDPFLRKEMLEYLKQLWKQENNSVIFVTHDVDEAFMLADRVIMLGHRPGRILDEVKLIYSPYIRNVENEEVKNAKQIYYDLYF